MPSSYNGKILHVDLSEQRWWSEELDEIIYRKYLGGSALASYFMLRHIKPGIDALSPDNKLIFMTSVINGLPLSGANRYSAAGKSPLTGGFGEAEAGGYWGPELKRTGFDGEQPDRSTLSSTTTSASSAMRANIGDSFPARCRTASRMSWATTASACCRRA